MSKEQTISIYGSQSEPVGQRSPKLKTGSLHISPEMMRVSFASFEETIIPSQIKKIANYQSSVDKSIARIITSITLTAVVCGLLIWEKQLDYIWLIALVPFAAIHFFVKTSRWIKIDYSTPGGDQTVYIRQKADLKESIKQRRHTTASNALTLKLYDQLTQTYMS